MIPADPPFPPEASPVLPESPFSVEQGDRGEGHPTCGQGSLRMRGAGTREEAHRVPGRSRQARARGSRSL